MHWLSQSKTDGRYHAFAAPSSPRDWHGGPFPTHGELISSGTIARFLCEYSGPFWGMFSKIRLDIYIYIYFAEWLSVCSDIRGLRKRHPLPYAVQITWKDQWLIHSAAWNATYSFTLSCFFKVELGSPCSYWKNFIRAAFLKQQAWHSLIHVL